MRDRDRPRQAQIVRAVAAFLGLGPLDAANETASVARVMDAWHLSKNKHVGVRGAQDSFVARLGARMARNEWAIIFDPQQQLVPPADGGATPPASPSSICSGSACARRL